MSRYPHSRTTWATAFACAAFFAFSAARSAPVVECDAYAGSITTDSTQQCLVNGSVTLIAQPGGDAVIPPGYQIGYVLTSTNGLAIEQVGPDPTFTVSGVNIWRIHSLVYDPNTLDFAAILDLSHAYQLQDMLVQGGGDICASLNISGAFTKTTECDQGCEANAGTISALNPDQCLVDGTAQLEALPDGNAVVPAGYSVVHVLTTGPDLLILALGAEPSFSVSFEGPFAIHTLVYDPATLDLSGIVFGETSAFEIVALLQQGGGPICGSLDAIGAQFGVADCNPVCEAYAGTLTAVADEVCRVDGIAGLDATPNGDAVVPDGYSIAYILARDNGIIENVEPVTLFEWPLLGNYVIHTLVYDPFTIDPFDVVLGVTTIEEINSALIQGGGPICGSLDLVGAPISVIDCEPVCDAIAGTLTAVESEVCLVDGSADLDATPNGDAVVPSGYSVAYILARANGIIENVEPITLFEWPLIGDYIIHTLVYDPATLNPFTVILGVTNISSINEQLIQGGGTICGSLDLVGAAFTVIECAPPCDADAGIGGDRILCYTDPIADLFSLLTGTPDEGGTWTGPDGAAFAGAFNPAMDAQGVYVYFVTDGPDCPGDTTQLVISLIECPGPCTADAGPDASFSVCSLGGPEVLVLIDFISGDAGGSWTDPNGQPSDGHFETGISTPGAYAYVVGASEECDGDTAYVTVILVNFPSAGTSSDVSVCDSDAPFSCLELLGGSPDAGGSWTGPDGAPFDGTFDPTTDLPGVYQYTVLGTAPCMGAAATLNISVTSCCDAGEDAETTVCFTDEPFAMIDLLGGDPCTNGVWTDPADQAHSGLFNPGSDVPGVYTYTVQGGQALVATLTINVFECPDPCAGAAGEDTQVEVCNDGLMTDLFPLLSGSPLPGGSWFWASFGNINPEIFGGFYDSMIGQGGIAGYVVSAGPDCPNDTAYVTVTEIDCTDPCASSTPDAGIGGDIIRCTIDPIVELFDLLQGTPDVGGTWTGPDGAAFSGTFDPASDASGTYVYTVFDLQDCDPDTTQLNMDVIECPQLHAQLVAWPNPAVAQLSIRFPAVLSGSASIDIIDALGRSVRPSITRAGDLITVDVSTLPAGTYTLRAFDAKASYSGRFARARD